MHPLLPIVLNQGDKGNLVNPSTSARRNSHEKGFQGVSAALCAESGQLIFPSSYGSPGGKSRIGVLCSSRACLPDIALCLHLAAVEVENDTQDRPVHTGDEWQF